VVFQEGGKSGEHYLVRAETFKNSGPCEKEKAHLADGREDLEKKGPPAPLI